ncbi:MAG TPA: carboxypeptidase regulatory-like domain-containing protein [Silvibacterium sp.]|nr:carboxypeptidase regulatory-like domain-containing protein [Silvibacterium sp.]
MKQLFLDCDGVLADFDSAARKLFGTLFIFVYSYASAQSGISLGSLSGTVIDSSGAVVSGARIAVSSLDNTIRRSAITGADGTFVILNLPSENYQLAVSAPGFSSWRNPSLALAVGRTTGVTVRLAPARATQQVIVQSQTEALDTSQTSPVANIDRGRIEELPIPNRNYINFTLLAPAVAAANPALARQTPGAELGGFSAGGLRPTSNALYIDGTDDNDEYTGLSRTELSPEAISDFQIVNHGYEAQSGGSAGGSVNVETRSGGNLQHGDAFLFVQNGALNGTPVLEVVPGKADENRIRAGLSTGGRIEKSRLYYYLAGEQELARGEDASDFSPKLAAAIDGALRQAGPLHGFRLQQGFFPTTNQETELSGRLDFDSATQGLMLRYALTNNRSVNDAFHTDDLSDLSARGSAFYDDNSINGSWSWTRSPRLLNQLDFQLAQRRVALRTASTQEPGIVVAGIAHFGTPWDGNSRRYETHFDLGDSIVRQRGKHLFQAGIAGSHIALRSADLGGFQGLYVFPSLAALSVAQPDFYTQNYGDPDTNFGELRTAAWVQDHWTSSRSLALDYGLRYEDNHLPSSLPQHPFNFSPRVGFAWSPSNTWVVRGGFGIFVDRYLLSTINRIQQFNGVRARQQTVDGAQAASLYQSGQIFTAPRPDIAPSVWQAQPGLANPYAETASLGVEHQLPALWTISAEYRFVHGVKLGRTINSNLPPPVLLTANNASSLGIPAPTPQQLGRPVFSPQRLNPAYDAINQFQTEAGSRYNGATLTVNRQFTEEFELMAGYTFSKTIDDAFTDTEQPQNPYALNQERAPSLNDQRHRFVVSGLWVIGPDLDDPGSARAAKPNAFQKMVYGLEFAPIIQASSGFRDNALTGVDTNREHIFPFESRPLGFGRNSLRTPPQLHFDLRVLKMVPIWRGHLDIVAESFNLLNRQNTDLLNPVYGSDAPATSNFRAPLQESDARRIQFSLDYEF